MCFGFWFPSFREVLDIFSGALEPWNTHSQGKMDQKQGYYKDCVKCSEEWTETQETWHLLWPFERNSTKQCGSEDERNLRKPNISRMIWKKKVVNRKRLGPEDPRKCAVYIKRKTVMLLFFNISGIVQAAFIHKVKQSGRLIMQEF